MKIGDKLKFDTARQRFTVRAFDDHYVIATKPFNARKTYLYTIIDLHKRLRGPCDLIFGPSYDLHGGEAEEALQAMRRGEFDVSRRRGVSVSDREFAQLQ